MLFSVCFWLFTPRLYTHWSFQSLEALEEVVQISSDFEDIKHPLGTRDNPAMTCKELVGAGQRADGEMVHGTSPWRCLF